MKRIVIDCDPGNGIAGANVDDGLALALALAADSIKLELITIVAGNTPRDTGYRVARQLLQELNKDIPVVKGAAQALIEPAAPWREQLDNNVRKQGLLSLWDNLPPLSALNDHSAPHAAQAIGELVCGHPGEITVVAIGPLTNIAHTIQLYPDFARSVAEIVIMGGVFQLDGYLKDTNFAVDPEAAKIVIESGANITLAPLDVTTQTMLTHQDLDKLQSFANPLTDFIVRTSRPWMDYSIHTRHLAGCWIHDVLCVAKLIDSDIVTSSPYIVDVSTARDCTRASSRRWKEGALRLTVGMPEVIHQPVNVMESVDNQRLLDIIFNALGQYRC
ncbi:hydrolase [Snodgrassella communis]|uniref:Inosine-uridine preferring nucleoside hydrolase n=1 Tax=Snodgrassella communis TaxID=2946699 RepID=A0A066TRJ3_9NEIS|nr:nucleoside hydrolase [Snodgrassella communis]KDN12157.1 Inosine-uridine preferring nucleoside hydrolase [Snodgrassella communis]KDN14648.1 Inosine-uridine preferring nucleoside hydrolase [Snodgrassella communis]PIT08168.1 hydrolase [Snodgrassella communis]PIT26137.1 hydrolase [Snodgrassella communis]PIT26636.1 hydrolase [Snodgrassella communis]